MFQATGVIAPHQSMALSNAAGSPIHLRMRPPANATGKLPIQSRVSVCMRACVCACVRACVCLGMGVSGGYLSLDVITSTRKTNFCQRSLKPRLINRSKLQGFSKFYKGISFPKISPIFPRSVAKSCSGGKLVERE